MTTIAQACAEIDRLRAALDTIDDENSQLKVKLVIALDRITELEDILGRSEDKRYEP